MKKILQSALIVLFVAVGLTSCKNNVPKEAKYIPKTAGAVFILDPQQMQDKLQKGGISIDTLISTIFKNDEDGKEKAHFEDVKNNAGIDWGNKLFLFIQQKTNADKTQSTAFTVIGGLKDAAKLEAFLKKQDHLKDKEIKKATDYSYINLHEGTLLAWNKDQLIATMYTHTAKPSFDTATMTYKQPATGNVEAELKTEVDRYFTQKVSESLADVKMFTDMFKDKADGYIFTSSNSAISALSMLPFQPPKLEEFMKDNFTTSTLTFEDGKILAKTVSYPNKLVSGILKQYAGPTVDLSMIENYPSQNINGIILAAFNPEIFGGVLKQLEVEGIANAALEKAGISTQDLYKSLKGNIAVVVSDLGLPATGPEPQMKHDEKSMMKKKSIGKMILNAPVGDQASFFKLMDKAVAQGVLVKENNTYRSGALLSMFGLFVRADASNLIIASDSLTYTQYMAKTNKAVINKEALDRFKGKSMVMYFDIANTVNGFISKDSAAAMNYDHSLKSIKQNFKDMFGTMDNFDGTTLKSVFEVRMQNEKQNSLVTLTSLFTDIAVDMRAQAKKEREMQFPGGVPAIIRTN